MKSSWRVLALVLALLLVAAVVAYAAQHRGGMRGGGGGMRGGGGRGGGMGGPGAAMGRGGMSAGSMHGMVLTSAVSASGENVYVLVGTQLMKYDANLNLMKEVEVKVPLVVRMRGTNMEEGMRMLAESDLKTILAEDLTDAAQKAVAAAEGR